LVFIFSFHVFIFLVFIFIPFFFSSVMGAVESGRADSAANSEFRNLCECEPESIDDAHHFEVRPPNRAAISFNYSSPLTCDSLAKELEAAESISCDSEDIFVNCEEAGVEEASLDHKSEKAFEQSHERHVNDGAGSAVDKRLKRLRGKSRGLARFRNLVKRCKNVHFL
jgi:hypothetical protein